MSKQSTKSGHNKGNVFKAPLLKCYTIFSILVLFTPAECKVEVFGTWDRATSGPGLDRGRQILLEASALDALPGRVELGPSTGALGADGDVTLQRRLDEGAAAVGTGGEFLLSGHPRLHQVLLHPSAASRFLKQAI